MKLFYKLINICYSIKVQTSIAHRHARQKQDKANGIDKIIYIAAIAAPLSNIPQLVKAWTATSTAGISAVSWFSFALISLIWLLYGRIHKELPIILMNGSLLCVQLLIATAVLVR